jgi:hypothetical protein
LIDDRGVRWNCHHCQWRGWQFYAAPPSAERKSPIITKTCNDADNDRARIRRAQEIGKGALNPTGTLVEQYLASRGLCLLDGMAGRVISFHPACPWWDDDIDKLIYVPAMLAAMRDVHTDELRAFQITALNPDGTKIARKTRGLAGGSVIKLSPDENVEYGLTIGEGVETVLAAMQFNYRPAWACAGTSNLQSFPVLAGIEALTILVDHDEPGQRAAAECAQRWLDAGVEVFRVQPRQEAADFNDLIGGLYENA